MITSYFSRQDACGRGVRSPGALSIPWGCGRVATARAPTEGRTAQDSPQKGGAGPGSFPGQATRQHPARLPGDLLWSPPSTARTRAPPRAGYPAVTRPAAAVLSGAPCALPPPRPAVEKSAVSLLSCSNTGRPTQTTRQDHGRSSLPLSTAPPDSARLTPATEAHTANRVQRPPPWREAGRADENGDAHAPAAAQRASSRTHRPWRTRRFAYRRSLARATFPTKWSRRVSVPGQIPGQTPRGGTRQISVAGAQSDGRASSRSALQLCLAGVGRHTSTQLAHVERHGEK